MLGATNPLLKRGEFSEMKNKGEKRVILFENNIITEVSETEVKTISFTRVFN